MNLKDSFNPRYDDLKLDANLEVKTYNEKSKENAKELFKELQKTVEEFREEVEK